MLLPKKKNVQREAFLPFPPPAGLQVQQASAHTDYEVLSYARSIAQVRNLVEWRGYVRRLKKLFGCKAVLTGWDESLRTQPVLRDMHAEGFSELAPNRDWAKVLRHPLVRWRQAHTTQTYEWQDLLKRSRMPKGDFAELHDTDKLTFAARRGPIGATAFFVFVNLDLSADAPIHDFEWLLTLTWEAGVSAWWHEHKELLGQKGQLLSDRERQHLCLIADGRTDPDISALTGRSIHTVRNQTARLTKKLGVSNRLTAVLLAYEFGWISMPELLNSELEA